MALNWPWAALRASGHRELRKGGDTIPCTFSRGVAVPLLCTPSVLSGVPCLLGINYVLEFPRKMLFPSFFIFFCIPSENRVVLQISKSWPQHSSSLTGKSKSKSMHYWRARKWLCVGNTTTTYSLTCPCKFCFQQKYHLKFYPKFMRYLWRVWY